VSTTPPAGREEAVDRRSVRIDFVALRAVRVADRHVRLGLRGLPGGQADRDRAHRERSEDLLRDHLLPRLAGPALRDVPEERVARVRVHKRLADGSRGLLLEQVLDELAADLDRSPRSSNTIGVRLGVIIVYGWRPAVCRVTSASFAALYSSRIGTPGRSSGSEASGAIFPAWIRRP
jgi:hypothetical protein